MAKKGELAVELALKDFASKALKTFEGNIDRTTNVVNRQTSVMSSKFAKLSLGITAAATAFLAVVKVAEMVGRAVVIAARVGIRAVRSMYDHISRVAEGLDKMAKMAVRFSESARSLTEFRLIAELTGTSIENIGTAMRAGARNAADYRNGMGEAADEFIKLGITQEEVLNQVKTGGDLIELVASRWGNLQDGIEKTNAAQKIFGRGGLDIVPILEMEASAIKELRQLVRDLGGSFSGAALKPVEAMNDAFTILRFSVNAVKDQFLVALAPSVERVVTAFNKIIKTVAPTLRLVIKEVGDWFGKVADNAREFLDRHQETLENAVAAIPNLIERGITDIKTVAMTSLKALGKLFLAAGVSIGDLLGTGILTGMATAMNKVERKVHYWFVDLLGIGKEEDKKFRHWDKFELIPTEGYLDASLKRGLERIEKVWEANKSAFDKVLGKLFGDGGGKDKPHDLGTMTVTGKPDVKKTGPSMWDNFLAGFDSVLERFNNMATRMQDLGASLASGLTNAFDNLFFDLMENKFKNLGEVFKSFARNVVRALQQIAAQQLALQAVSGIRSAFGAAPGGDGGPYTVEYVPEAKGDAFRGGRVVPFAKGGALAKPTIFPMADGATGLMGEAGPEAIMPLKRGPGGRLGVEASGVGGFASVFNDNKTIVSLNQVNNITVSGGGDAGPAVAAALKESEGRMEAMLDKKFSGSGRFRRQVARVRA